MKTTSCYVPLLTAAYVSAHGYLSLFTINGQPYNGNVPAGTTSPSAIRQINTTFPNYGASNPNINCGPGSTPAALVATANPGDALTFQWRDVGDSNWPHNTGPIMTYLADCGSTTSDKCDSTNLKWFKIDQQGKQSNDSSLWVQETVMNEGAVTLTLPKNLKQSNYLMRSEIIALQLAVTMGMAEFYPACSQLKVGGNENGAPNEDELVTFPGGYNNSEPGLYDPNVYTPGAPYVFPGPPIASFVTGTSSTSGNSSSSSTVTATTTPTAGSATPIQSSPASSQSCMVMTPSNTPYADVVQPRHFSRIMRRLFALGH